MEPIRAGIPQRVVMVGYLCSGKSTVGEALARRLEWGVLDFDAEIERREGRSVRAVVEEAGEAYLRKVETALTEEALAQSGLVIAPGGGWITRPELLQALGPETLSVWLQASPSTVLERLLASPIDHPLREQSDALDRIGETMRERAPVYRLSDLAVSTEGRAVEAIAFEIEQMIRARRSTLLR